MPMAVVYLSVRLISSISSIFAQTYKMRCPVVCVYRASWYSEVYLLTRLNKLNNDLKQANASQVILLIIGKSLLNTKHIGTKLYS